MQPESDAEYPAPEAPAPGAAGTEAVTEAAPAESAVGQPRRLQPSRANQAIEVCVFLVLIVPSMILFLLARTAARSSRYSFNLTAASMICRDVGWVCLALYFVWRNGEGLASVGWTLRRWRRDLVAGVLSYPALLFTAGPIALLGLKLGLTMPKTAPIKALLPYEGGWQVPLLMLLFLVVAVTEETVFRGYLLLRFTAITRSRAAAIFLATAIFASGHVYEGTLGLVVISFLGLVFTALYLWTGSLVAPIAAHFLWDLLAVLLAPYFQRSVPGG